jgi:hypothetical protein
MPSKNIEAKASGGFGTENEREYSISAVITINSYNLS